MRYVVYGAGAVGGVIGAHLHRGGVDVTLVARGAHLAAIRERGLRLDTALGSDLVDVRAVGGAADVEWGPDSAVLLCVKSHQTAAALDDLTAHVPPATPVVSVQNGVANEQAILRRFARTYAVCVMLPSSHLEPGVVAQKCHPTPGILDVGRFPGDVDPVVEAIAGDLRRGGFESVPRPDIMAWKHRKLIRNLGNGVDAVCVPGDGVDELVGLATAEGEGVLLAAGIPVVPEAEDDERRGDVLRSTTGPWQSGGSTWQSVRRGGGFVEIDYLSGEVVLLGRLHGVPTPVNELLQEVTSGLARAGGEPRSVPARDLLDRLR
jgi:2-dehydropantoate 2-reductase